MFVELFIETESKLSNLTAIETAVTIAELDSVSINNSTNIQRNGVYWGKETAGNSPIPVNIFNGGQDIAVLGDVRPTLTEKSDWIKQVNDDNIRLKGDLFLTGIMGASTLAADSILVKNSSTKRVELVPQSRFTGGGGGGSYTLPIATASTLGGIRIGSGLAFEASTGIVSTTGGGGGSGYARSDSLVSAGNVTVNGGLIANGQTYNQNTVNIATGNAIGLNITNGGSYEMFFNTNNATNIHSAATTVGMYFSTAGAPIHFGNTDGGEMLKLSGANLITASVPFKLTPMAGTGDRYAGYDATGTFKVMPDPRRRHYCRRFHHRG